MNNHILKIRNLRKIKQKLQCYKRKKGSQNPYHPSLNCHIVNSATLNFKATHSKLFSHLCVQLEKLEECLKWLPKAVNIPLKKQTLEPKIKVTKRVAVCCRRNCYIQIRCLDKNSKGTYIKSSLDPNLWIWVKIDMSLKKQYTLFR